jgi:hypothetical protein
MVLGGQAGRLGTDRFGYLERADFLSVQLLAGASGADIGGAKPSLSL